MADAMCVDVGGVLVPGQDAVTEPRQINRRQLLTGLAFAGAGAAGAAVVTSAVDLVGDGGAPAVPPAPPRVTMTLRGAAVRFEPLGAAPGVLPALDRPFGVRGALVDEAGEVGHFEMTPMPGVAGVLELHTFDMGDGTLLGLGSASRGTGTFAVVGGTGRYRGASGSYTAQVGDGPSAPTAEFLFDLSLGA